MNDQSEFRRNRRIAILLFLFAIVVSSTSIDPNDTWWHIRSGQYYLETHTIPQTDVFSHTAVGKPVFTHEWLSQILLYKIYDWFGFWGIRILNSLMAAVTLLFIWRLFRRATDRLLPILFGILVIYPDFLGRCNTRPEIFTLPLTVAFLYFILHRDRRILPGWRTLAGVGILAVAWANLHGMALLGLMFLCVYTFGELLTYLIQWKLELPDWKRVTLTGIKGDILLIIVYGVAVLASPMGWNIYLHAWEGRQFLPGPLGIMEWLSPFMFLGGILHSFLTSEFPWINVQLAWQFLFLAIPLAYFFSLPALARRQKLPTLGEFLMVMLAMYQGASVVRFRWLFIIPLFWVIRAIGLALRSPVESTGERRAGVAAMILTPLMLLIMATGIYILFNRNISFTRPIDRNNYPVGIANLLDDVGIGGKLFNTYNWGGYLIFRLATDYKVFIDGRTDLYSFASRNLLLDHVTIDNKQEGYQELLDSYGVDILLGTNKIYFPGSEYEAEMDRALKRQKRALGTYTQSMRGTSLGKEADTSETPDTVSAPPVWIPILINREGSIYLRNRPDLEDELHAVENFYKRQAIPFSIKSGPGLTTIIRDHPKLAVKYGLLTDEIIRDVIRSLSDSESDRSIEARIEVARTLILLEFFRDGIAVLEKVLEIDRYNIDGLLLIGRAYHLIGKTEQAMTYLERAANVGRSEAAAQYITYCRRTPLPVSSRPARLPDLETLARGWQSHYTGL